MWRTIQRKEVRSMRFNVYYGTEPRITDAERHNYDRGNYECAMVMKDRKEQPVIVSRSKDPSFPVWKVECGFSCFAFLSKAEAMAFCEKRYRKAKGGAK